MSKDKIEKDLQLKDLNKEKIYCKHCFVEGKIKELKLGEDSLVELCDIHNKMKGNFHILVFLPDYNDFLDVRGRDPKKRPEKERVKATIPGICSIKGCGRYNLSRDQNGRGRDVGYGDGEWIATEEIELKDKNGNVYRIIKIGEKCGCNCSQAWYTEHNQSKEMRQKSKESMEKLLKRDDIFYPCPECNFPKTSYLLECPNCHYDPHVDFDYRCENCNYPINSPGERCPNCNHLHEKKCYCQKCKSEIKYSNSECTNCGFRPKAIIHHICPNCGFEEDQEGSFWTCKSCNYTTVPKNNGRHLKYCEECNKETLHDRNENCLVCSGEYKLCPIHEEYEPIERIKREMNRKTPYYISCDKCGNKTPHKFNKATGKLECLVCSGLYVFCDTCQRWERIEN